MAFGVKPDYVPSLSSFARRRRCTLSGTTISTPMKSKIAKVQSLKRKLKGDSAPPRKKVKLTSNNLEALPWKAIESAEGFNDGMLGLEEIEGVEVVYEETGKGKVAKFNVRWFSRVFLHPF